MYSPAVNAVENLQTRLALVPVSTELNPTEVEISIEYSMGRFGKIDRLIQSKPADKEAGFLAALEEFPVYNLYPAKNISAVFPL